MRKSIAVAFGAGGKLKLELKSSGIVGAQREDSGGSRNKIHLSSPQLSSAKKPRSIGADYSEWP
jgi:hypothetical protein